MHRVFGGMVAAAVALAGWTSVMRAQGQGQEAVVVASGRGPQYLMAAARPSQPARPVDAASVPVLRRRVTLALDDVRRVAAVAAVGQAAGIRLVYASGVIPSEG